MPKKPEQSVEEIAAEHAQAEADRFAGETPDVAPVELDPPA